MNRVKKHLLYLAVGEFAALCTFVFLYRSLNLGMASYLAFSYLVFILLQGSIYWFVRYLLLLRKNRFNHKTIIFLAFLRRLNIILLVPLSVLMFLLKSSTIDFVIAIVVYLFGIIEYVNYYWYRLSYGKSGFNIRVLLTTQLQKSSINKLISYLEKKI